MRNSSPFCDVEKLLPFLWRRETPPFSVTSRSPHASAQLTLRFLSSFSREPMSFTRSLLWTNHALARSCDVTNSRTHEHTIPLWCSPCAELLLWEWFLGKKMSYILINTVFIPIVATTNDITTFRVLLYYFSWLLILT